MPPHVSGDDVRMYAPEQRCKHAPVQRNRPRLRRNWCSLSLQAENARELFVGIIVGVIVKAKAGGVSTERGGPCVPPSDSSNLN